MKRMLMAAGGLAALITLTATVPMGAHAETLYTLESSCSLEEGAPQPCVIEASEEKNATVYRHRIGNQIETIRISDVPVRMSRWDADSNSWMMLDSVGARFSTNTICFNGLRLCVVNANYLNSVREEEPEATAGRDLIRVKFDRDGRVLLTCYDEGCKELKG